VSRHTDSAGAIWETREDRGDLLASHVRPDGTLLVEGFAAREGVLEYRRADGSIRREMVPAQTLLDSAATLGRAPVTLEHPSVDVTPDNVGTLGVGDVDGEVRLESGGFVRVKLAVRRRDAIQAAKDNRKRELSPGYRVRLDETPGVDPVHGAYDAVQVERTYNHLAIVERARGGAEVRFRADSVAVDSISTPAKRGTMNPGFVTLLSVLGITQRFDSDEAALYAVNDTLTKRNDAAAAITADRDACKARADSAEAQRDTEKARADKATADLEALRAAEKARTDAAELATLQSLAKAMQVDPGTLAAPALKRAIAKAHLGTEPKADASDAYLDAVVDLASASRKDGRKAGNDAWAGTGTPRVDADPARKAPRKTPAQIVRDNYDAAFEQGRKGGEQ